MTSINNVTVAGSGVLGSQIAYQCAYRGKQVTVYDINDQAIEKAKSRIAGLESSYTRDLGTSAQNFAEGLSRISYTTDLKTATDDADIVIESVPEKPQIKHDFYVQLSAIAPAKTIFASNSSTLVPSQFMADTGRPAQFLNLHFANEVWKNNTAEIMGSTKTDPKVYDTVVEFAKEIGMLPIKLKKEQPRYILNSILDPYMDAGLTLWAKGVADPHTIDQTWMKATGAPMGPFAVMDHVGLRTEYNIHSVLAKESNNTDLIKAMTMIKSMIDDGHLGVESGEGFYTYPDPLYEQESFLKVE